MSKTTEKETERAQALERLREMLNPGDTVYTILRHVSRSGMQRSIGVILHTKDGPVEMDWAVARAMGEPFDRKRGGVKVNGCGMDMGFHLVYSLSRTLWPDGFGCTGKEWREPNHCPSNDHSNGDRDYTPHVGAAGVSSDPAGHHWHTDGGYALTHRWL